MIREVYLDNSATTPVREEVAEAIMDVLTNRYGNPSSLHRMGIVAEKLVKESRQILAQALGVKDDEIFFTSGGTESNNLAIKGAARANCRWGRHLLTTAVEHPSVLNACAQLEEEGFRVTYLQVNAEGVIAPEELEAALTPETILVSTMFVNNEVGSIQPLTEIGAILKKRENIVWHVDAVQGFAKLPIRPKQLGIKLLSISGHKFHGPKGVGALYVAKNTRLAPLFGGGGQELGLRSGTENVPGIVGLGKAAALALDKRDKAAARMGALKELLREEILTRIPGTRLNGPQTGGAPHILNISFAGVKGEILVHALEEAGIYVSTGSACSSRQAKTNHVLEALGLDPEYREGALRFSLSPLNTQEEMEYTVAKLAEIVPELRLFQRR
jgi:cysteine desulfurase